MSNPWEHQEAWLSNQKDATEGVVKTAPVAPNRMKFASSVGKLDARQPDYMDAVCSLQDEFSARQHLIDRLVSVCTTGQVEERLFYVLQEDEAKRNQLADILRAAIERFVVDNY